MPSTWASQTSGHWKLCRQSSTRHDRYNASNHMSPKCRMSWIYAYKINKKALKAMELNKTTLNEQIIQVKYIYIYWRKIAIWYLIYDVPSLQYSPQTKKNTKKRSSHQPGHELPQSRWGISRVCLQPELGKVKSSFFLTSFNPKRTTGFSVRFFWGVLEEGNQYVFLFMSKMCKNVHNVHDVPVVNFTILPKNRYQNWHVCWENGALQKKTKLKDPKKKT